MSSAHRQHRQRIFVGDVHGCADELDELLTRIGYTPAHHRLWFVGDLVNRGPKSLQTLRRVRELGGNSVLGNHDLHAIARWNGVRPAKPRDTLDELLDAPDAAELMGWLRRRPPIVGWDDLVLVHAGLHPRWKSPENVRERILATVDWRGDPFEQAELAFAATVRCCGVDGEQPTSGLEDDAQFAPWDSYYHGERTVVFGHWAQRGMVRGPRVRGLDTGCVWGGRLTAWLPDGDRFVSVAAHEHYQAIDSD